MPITPNVYQIHKEHHELTGFTTLEIIEHIFNRGRLKLQLDKAFDENDLSTFQREDFTYHLFLMNTSEHESDWSEFLPERLTADNDSPMVGVSPHHNKKPSVYVHTEGFLFLLVEPEVSQSNPLYHF